MMLPKLDRVRNICNNFKMDRASKIKYDCCTSTSDGKSGLKMRNLLRENENIGNEI